jgi:hypothetical protein
MAIYTKTQLRFARSRRARRTLVRRHVWFVLQLSFVTRFASLADLPVASCWHHAVRAERCARSEAGCKQVLLVRLRSTQCCSERSRRRAQQAASS